MFDSFFFHRMFVEFVRPGPSHGHVIEDRVQSHNVLPDVYAALKLRQLRVALTLYTCEKSSYVDPGPSMR